MSNKILQVVTALVGGLVCLPAAAGLVVEQALDFGTIVITDNNSVSQLTIPMSGNATSSNKIYITRQGQAAQLRFFSYPAFTVLSFAPVFPVQSTNGVGATQEFTLSQILMPPTATTNATGEVLVKMGAVLQSSGSGLQYQNTDYQFAISIVVTY